MPRIALNFCMDYDLMQKANEFAQMKGISRSKLIEIAIIRLMRKEAQTNNTQQ